MRAHLRMWPAFLGRLHRQLAFRNRLVDVAGLVNLLRELRQS